MFCTNCGKEIPDSSQFCEYCGKSTQSKLQSTKNIQVTIQRRKKFRKRANVCIIGSFI